MNLVLQLIAVVILSTLLLACTSWPEEGQGGFAEQTNNHLITVEHDKVIDARHGLRFDYTLLKNQLSLLKLQGAPYCFPASVDNAEQLENRIVRELSAGLYDSASVNIVNQRLALHELSLKLELIIDQSKCTPPKSIRSDLARRQILLNLLNSDNQFAIDSSEINQKYKANLKAAVPLLVTSNYLKILIIGRADSNGNEIYNIELSQKRAKQVKDFLITNGLEADTIEVIAVGENAPLYHGDSDTTRLINRNVNVYVIED